MADVANGHAREVRFRFSPALPGEQDIDRVQPIIPANEAVSEGKQCQGSGQKIDVNDRGAKKSIDVTRIVYVAAEGHYTRISYLDPASRLQTKLCDDSISAVSRQLGNNFILIHRSYIANLSYVAGCVKRSGNGQLMMSVDGAPALPVSRSRYSGVKLSVQRLDVAQAQVSHF
jgi:DNA-binding LytR/AlgR family response regulator